MPSISRFLGVDHSEHGVGLNLQLRQPTNYLPTHDLIQTMDQLTKTPYKNACAESMDHRPQEPRVPSHMQPPPNPLRPHVRPPTLPAEGMGGTQTHTHMRRESGPETQTQPPAQMKREREGDVHTNAYTYTKRGRA